MDYFDDDDLDSSELQDDAGELDDQGSYVCDSCGEEIVIPIDVSAGSHQRYVEDCPVCCHPNVIAIELDQDGHPQVIAGPEQDYH